MPTPIGCHVFPRLNLSDVAGVALLIAIVLVVLYSFSNLVAWNDEGIPCIMARVYSRSDAVRTHWNSSAGSSQA